MATGTEHGTMYDGRFEAMSEKNSSTTESHVEAYATSSRRASDSPASRARAACQASLNGRPENDARARRQPATAQSRMKGNSPGRITFA